VVIGLQRGANVVQLMPLPSHHLLLQYNPEWFAFWCWLTPVVLEKRPLNGCSSSSIKANLCYLATAVKNWGMLVERSLTVPCPCRWHDGNYCIYIRKKTSEFSTVLLPAPSQTQIELQNKTNTQLMNKLHLQTLYRRNDFFESLSFIAALTVFQ